MKNFLLNQANIFLLIALTSFGLFAGALFFQYWLGYEPCIMCVYQRLAVLCCGALALIAFGFAKMNNNYVNAPLSIILIGVTVYGSSLAYEHIQMQRDSGAFSFYSCEIVPNFPSFLPLHEWVPSVFEATGSCDKIDWMFLGQSMPAWVYLFFMLFFTLSVAVFLWAAHGIYSKNRVRIANTPPKSHHNKGA